MKMNSIWNIAKCKSIAICFAHEKKNIKIETKEPWFINKNSFCEIYEISKSKSKSQEFYP